MAREVEADVWERVATKMEGMKQQGTRTSAGGGFIRAFVSDLSRVVDGHEVGYTLAHRFSCLKTCFRMQCEKSVPVWGACNKVVTRFVNGLDSV